MPNENIHVMNENQLDEYRLRLETQKAKLEEEFQTSPSVKLATDIAAINQELERIDREEEKIFMDMENFGGLVSRR